MQTTSIGRPLRALIARLHCLPRRRRAGLRSPASPEPPSRWPVLTTSACARQSGATSERNGRDESSPSSKQTSAAGFSGESALSVMATTETPRSRQASAVSTTAGV